VFLTITLKGAMSVTLDLLLRRFDGALLISIQDSAPLLNYKNGQSLYNAISAGRINLPIEKKKGMRHCVSTVKLAKYLDEQDWGV
jgi:hypothetical protein